MLGFNKKPETKKPATLESYQLEVAKRDSVKAIITSIVITALVFTVIGTIIGYFLSINIVTDSQNQALEILKTAQVK
ncbi:MAG: hypothetical protein ACOH18_05525 [Candidatus Saccharimonadaceae bacterium]